MNSGTETEQPVPGSDVPSYSVPWKFSDNWIGVALLVLIEVVLFIIVTRGPGTEIAQSIAIVLLESVYLLPVVLILAWRRVHWKHLGFRKFEWGTLGLGCGLLVGGYAIIMVHNILLDFLGVELQGEAIAKMLAALDSPVWFFTVAVVFAPLVEEMFFRGFLFQGLRSRYGWINAMLVSSAIFALGHLDLASLIPTFILGNVLAYVYHRSNSVWPGILLHFLNNAFSSCVAYLVIQNPQLIPV